MKEIHMAESKRTTEKIARPEFHYLIPNDIVRDHTLSPEEKDSALSTWEQDARQLLAASNEGMPGSDKGSDKHNRNRLGEIVRAKTKIGKKPKHQPFHQAG
jgi:hypothetical protein